MNWFHPKGIEPWQILVYWVGLCYLGWCVLRIFVGLWEIFEPVWIRVGRKQFGLTILGWGASVSVIGNRQAFEYFKKRDWPVYEFRPGWAMAFHMPKFIERRVYKRSPK